MVFRMRIFGPLFLLPGVLFILGGCASGDVIGEKNFHDFESAPFLGMVYTSENAPCNGATIQLLKSGKAKEKAEVKSDINGRFMLPDVPKGVHRIRVFKAGYEPSTISFDFADPTQVFYTQLLSLSQILGETEKSLDARRWKEAEEWLIQARQIDSRSGEVLFLEAVLYVSTEQIDKAQKVIKRMISSGFNDPRLEEFLINLGVKENG